MILSYCPLTIAVDRDPYAWGRNAVNYPGLILISRRAARPAAVYAQEMREALPKTWRALVAFAVVAALSILLTPWLLLLAPVAAFLTNAIGQGAEATRKREIIGHEIEVQAAKLLYAENVAEHRQSEAEALVSRNKAFIGWEPRSIVAEMEAMTAEAAAWVARNMPKILNVKERLG